MIQFHIAVAQVLLEINFFYFKKHFGIIYYNNVYLQKKMSIE